MGGEVWGKWRNSNQDMLCEEKFIFNKEKNSLKILCLIKNIINAPWYRLYKTARSQVHLRLAVHLWRSLSCLQSWRWCLQVWASPWAHPSGLHTGCDMTQYQCQTKSISWGTLHPKTYEEIVKEISTCLRKTGAGQAQEASWQFLIGAMITCCSRVLTCLGTQKAKWHGRWQGRWNQLLKVWIVSYPYCLLVKPLYLPLKGIHNKDGTWTVPERYVGPGVLKHSSG